MVIMVNVVMWGYFNHIYVMVSHGSGKQ